MRPELCDLLGLSGSTASEMTKKIWGTGVEGGGVFRDSEGAHILISYYVGSLYLYIYPLEANETGR